MWVERKISKKDWGLYVFFLYRETMEERMPVKRNAVEICLKKTSSDVQFLTYKGILGIGYKSTARVGRVRNVIAVVVVKTGKSCI